MFLRLFVACIQVEFIEDAHADCGSSWLGGHLYPFNIITDLSGQDS